MRRRLFFVCAFACPLAVAGQATSPTSFEEPIVVSNTGGERSDAKQPNLDEVGRAILKRTNAFRQEQKQTPVTPNERLTQAAESFAAFMARTGKYGHEADGRKPTTRVEEAGFKYCIVRENIAYTFRTGGFATNDLADEFLRGWKTSPGHRRNMFAPWITSTGVAVAKSESTDTYFAVQVFGRQESEAIEFEIVNESSSAVRYRIADQEHTIAPRVVSTHKACTPQNVVFLAPMPAATASKPSPSVATITPGSKDRLLITSIETGGYRVTVKRHDASEKSTAFSTSR